MQTNNYKYIEQANFLVCHKAWAPNDVMPVMLCHVDSCGIWPAQAFGKLSFGAMSTQKKLLLGWCSQIHHLPQYHCEAFSTSRETAMMSHLLALCKSYRRNLPIL